MMVTSLVTDTAVIILAQGHTFNIFGRSQVDKCYIPNITALGLAVSDKKIFHLFEQTW